MLKSVLGLIRREPARAFALLKAALVVGLSFGMHVTLGQQEALLALAALILGSGETTRALVSPTAKAQP